MSISIKALVTTLILGSSAAVFAHPAPTKVVERTQYGRGDRKVEQVRVDYKSYDRDRGDRDRGDRDRGDRDRGDRDRDRGDRWRIERERNLRERGHGRVIDHGPVFRGRR